jgi:outer membrane murein-binding lipoprotein Lpp
MKTISLAACGVAVMLLVATVFAADKKQPTPAETNAKVEELAKQVDSLQAKVKDMEQRLAKMEKARDNPADLGAPAATTPTIILPRAIQQQSLLENNFADPNRPPKIWGEGESNGWKYYMIPLSATGQGAATAIPLAGDSLAGR